MADLEPKVVSCKHALRDFALVSAGSHTFKIHLCNWSVDCRIGEQALTELLELLNSQLESDDSDTALPALPASAAKLWEEISHIQGNFMVSEPGAASRGRRAVGEIGVL